MRFIVLVFALLVSAASLAQSSPTPFVAEGVYSVDFGGTEPKVLEDALQGEGGNARRSLYVVEQGPAFRMLGTLVLPNGPALEDDEYFDSMIDSVRNGMPGMEVVIDRPTTAGAHRGREIEAENSQVTVVARMFVTRKGLVFAQSVFAKGDAAGRALASEFVGSLSIASAQ